MKKILTKLTGIALVLIIGFFGLAALTGVRSTNETYVCSGNLTHHGVVTNDRLFKFKIERQFSMLSWTKEWHSSINGIDEHPMIFFVSTTILSDKIYWSETFYGKNMRVDALSYSLDSDVIFDFDFETKIVSLQWFDKTGKNLNLKYRGLCNKV
jgi:hypothetical protein